jgi:CHAT domain-containing protein/tetratricopeptide (TPR) repeat protein
VRIAAAIVLWGALASVGGAQTAAENDDKARAAELLALTDPAARENWLETHRAALTPGLGREIVAAARVHYLASRYAPATEAFGLALRVGEIIQDPESRIRGLEGLGNVQRFRGYPAEALPFLERAKTEAEAAGDEAAVGRILGAIGAAKRMLGEFGASLALFQRQLEIFERLGDKEWIARTEFNIGTALGATGRCEEALPHLEQARVTEEALGLTALVTNVYNNIGLCHMYLGDHAAALEAFGHCLQIAEASGQRNELVSPLDNIGNVYLALGAPLRALEYFRRSTALATGQGEYAAESLANEGETLLLLDRPQEALTILTRALSQAEESHRAPTIVAAAAALAQVHVRLGDRPLALKLLNHSLEMAEQTGEMPLVAHGLRQIAALRLEEGQPAEAASGAERAAEMARRYGLLEERWPALTVLGRAQRALGHPDAAEAALREAVGVVEELRENAVGPEADRASFFVPHVAPYQELVALLADAGRPWDALAVAERSKGRVLLDVLAGGRAAIGAALSPADRAEERRLEGEILTLNSELRALLLQAQPDAGRRKALEDARAARRLALEDWRARQYAAHAELRVQRGELPPLGREDAGGLLSDSQTVLLEYSLAGDRGYVFALRAGAGGEPSLSVHPLPLATKELIRLARDLRERLARRDLEFDEPAARLHQALLGPARAVLAGARRVVLIPDGALWELPFQALRPRGGRYLVEDAAVSYAPSLSVLRDMRAHRRPPAPAGHDLLALGNPDLGAAARRRTPSVLMSDLQPLPEAETQVRAIARLYDSRASAVRFGVEARESWLKQEAAHYRILHFATHGLLDDASPLYSQLVLAAPRSGEGDDGLLEAREILEMSLDADLAVLSACETGRGQSGAGEGLIGMSWAFFVAGCPATVASQWKVEAASTSRLMLAFHRGLRAGHTPAEALRLAALAQLLRPDERHPFYWAGFVAMGDADSARTAAGPAPRRP